MDWYTNPWFYVAVQGLAITWLAYKLDRLARRVTGVTGDMTKLRDYTDRKVADLVTVPVVRVDAPNLDWAEAARACLTTPPGPAKDEVPVGYEKELEDTPTALIDRPRAGWDGVIQPGPHDSGVVGVDVVAEMETDLEAAAADTFDDAAHADAVIRAVAADRAEMSPPLQPSQLPGLYTSDDDPDLVEAAYRVARKTPPTDTPETPKPTPVRTLQDLAYGDTAVVSLTSFFRVSSTSEVYAYPGVPILLTAGNRFVVRVRKDTEDGLTVLSWPAGQPIPTVNNGYGGPKLLVFNGDVCTRAGYEA